MDPSSSPQPPPVVTLPLARAAAALCLAWLVALLWASFLPEDVHPDEGTYHYMGWLWLSGQGVPLVDALENKPPPIYLLYGLAHLVSPNPVLTMRMVALLTVGTTGVMLQHLLAKHTGRPVAAAATLMWATGVLAPSIELRAALTEPFMVAATTAAMVVALTRGASVRAAGWAGVLASVAFLFKPASLLEGVLVGALVVLGVSEPGGARAGRGARAAAFAAAYVTPQVLVWGAYAWMGHGVQYLHMVFFPPTPGINTPPSLLSRLVMVLTFLGWLGSKAPGWLVGVGAVATPGQEEPPGVQLLRKVGGLWLLAALPGVLAGWTWGHQYPQVGPPLAVLAGVALFRLERGVVAASPRIRAGVAMLLTAPMLAAALGNVQGFAQLFLPRPSTGMDAVAAFLRENVAPDERIFIHPVWDEVAARAERASFSRYFNGTYQSVAGAYDELAQALKDHPPRALVIHKRVPLADPHFDTPEHAPRRLAFGQLLRSHVAQGHVRAVETQDFEVFLRVDSPPQVSAPAAAEPPTPAAQ